jgi:1-acyl-sn-glycerol-3-phosphate acyltransferase
MRSGPIEPPSGPTEPLPPLRPKRWNRAIGFAFFLFGYAFACFWTIVCASTVFVVMLFSRDGQLFFRISRSWASTVLKVAGVSVETHLEGPLPEGPVVFVCNHQSTMDILALFVGLPRWFVFVAKKSIFSYPFLGWAIKAMQYISVNRGNREAAIKSLEAAAVRIRGGLSVTVFPEGTRSSDGSILPFKKGPFMLALHAGVPIVPVAIEGSLLVNPKRRMYLCPNTIRILVGPPIPTAGLGEADRDALIAAVRSNVVRMNRRLGGPGGDETTHVAARGFEGIGRAADDA